MTTPDQDWSFWRWLLRLHQHVWVERFRGTCLTGVQCRICGKPELLERPNDGTGWTEDTPA
jgi:hypothetical protein